MSKYIVSVNCKYLVTVEANSMLGAEHKCLDLKGIRYAQAFDQDGIKTDTFAGCMLTEKTVSFEELERISDEYAKNWEAAAAAKDTWADLQDEYERIEEQFRILKARRDAAQREMYSVLNTAKNYDKKIGAAD